LLHPAKRRPGFLVDSKSDGSSQGRQRQCALTRVSGVERNDLALIFYVHEDSALAVADGEFRLAAECDGASLGSVFSFKDAGIVAANR